MTLQPSPVPGNPEHSVVFAGQADIDVLSRVIADAFYSLAVSTWLIPDPDARRDIFPGYFRLHVEHAISAGIVYTTPGRTAAALWIPVGEHGPTVPVGYLSRLAAATGRWADRFQAFDLAMDRHHPTGRAHHHLALLAVLPDRQGQGIGTELLRAHHADLDRDGMCAYLEASGPDTRRIYLRHGYLLRPNAPIRLPGGPDMWPMWRQPQPITATRKGTVHGPR